MDPVSPESLVLLFLSVAHRDHQVARRRLAARDPAGAALALIDADRAMRQAGAVLESASDSAQTRTQSHAA